MRKLRRQVTDGNSAARSRTAEERRAAIAQAIDKALDVLAAENPLVWGDLPDDDIVRVAVEAGLSDRLAFEALVYNVLHAKLARPPDDTEILEEITEAVFARPAEKRPRDMMGVQVGWSALDLADIRIQRLGELCTSFAKSAHRNSRDAMVCRVLHALQIALKHGDHDKLERLSKVAGDYLRSDSLGVFEGTYARYNAFAQIGVILPPEATRDFPGDDPIAERKELVELTILAAEQLLKKNIHAREVAARILRQLGTVGLRWLPHIIDAKNLPVLCAAAALVVQPAGPASGDDGRDIARKLFHVGGMPKEDVNLAFAYRRQRERRA